MTCLPDNPAPLPLPQLSLSMSLAPVSVLHSDLLFYLSVTRKQDLGGHELPSSLL